MDNKLIQSHYYNVNFSFPYTSKGPYFVQVNALTRKASTDVYGEFDVRGAFFSNVGINTFLQMYNEETEVYICNAITSSDPIEVKTSENIFIPLSIIDFNTTKEYLEVDRFTLNIEGLTRRFERITDKIAFVNTLNDVVPDHLGNVDEFVGALLSCQVSEKQYLSSQDVIDEEVFERERLLNERDARIRNQQEKDFEQRKAILIQKNKNEADEVILSNRQIAFNKSVALHEDAVARNNNFINKIDQLKANLLQVHQELTEIAFTNGTAIITWEDLLRKYNII
jgi:hypothetical protein